MTFQIRPFSSDYTDSLLAAGRVPNMAEAYAAGEKQRRERDRLLAQQQASDLMAHGDRQGAINTMLSVADPGEALRYQVAQENAAAEQARQGVLDRRYEAEQAQQLEQQRVSNARAEESLRLQQEAARRAERIDQSKQPLTPEEAAQFGVTLPGAPGAPPGPALLQPPPGPRNPDFVPAPPQAPPAAPPVQQGPTADLPTNPAVTGGPAVTPQQQAQGAVAQAVQPAPGVGSPSAIGEADKQRRIADVIRGGGSREDVMKILTEGQRQNPPAVFQMEDKLRDDWRTETLPFQKRVEGYRDFEQAYKQAITFGPRAGPAHVAAVYSFMKNMDPQGAVLTSDAAMAEKSAGWWLAATNYVNSLEGKFVPKEVLEGMKQQVDARYGAAFQSYQLREQMMRDQAAAQGLDPYRAIEDQTGGVRPPKNWDKTEAAAAGAEQPGGYTPGQGGAAVIQQYWPEFIKRLNQRLNRGAGPQ